jgi:hypothetical protein
VFELLVAPKRRASIDIPMATGEGMARWAKGEQTVQFLVDRNRLESFEADDLAALTEALIGRAVLRVETTATAALAGGDVDGAFVAAYDAYRMTAEALLSRQGARYWRRRVAYGCRGCRVGAIRSGNPGIHQADI